MSHGPSDYDLWDVLDPTTECPDCAWQPENAPSNVGELLRMIDKHTDECPGMDLS